MARRIVPLLIVGVLLIGLIPPSPSAARASAPGAPAPGSGPVTLPGVRVIDGDSLDATIDGNRVAIGLVGLEAPQGNTACGQEARALLASLLAGGVRLEEDSAIDYDARGRRMYYAVTNDGRQAGEVLLGAGVARANGKGDRRGAAAASESQARGGGRGCLWGSNGRSSAPLAQPAASAATFQAMAPALPPNFSLDLIASGLNNPTAFAFLPDGRILIAEKAGLIRLVKNGTLQSTPLLDLRSRVNDYWDRGLLGLAVDPDFATNGHIYALYAYEHDAANYSGPKTARLSRYTVAGDTATAGSEFVVLGRNIGNACAQFPVGSDCLPSEWVGHSVGNIRFAGDKTIFVTVGDAANWNVVADDALRAQDLNSAAGKVLHIDRNGAGVPGNPYYDAANPGATRSKVWARGVRNAFRFSLRPENDMPYLGDVGWDNWEEINTAAAGANLGWPCYEGNGRQAGYEPKATCQTLYSQGTGAIRPPLVTYSHTVAGQRVSASVTGGAFYTGTSYPSQYQGAYFYGDYAMDFFRTLRVDSSDRLTVGPSDFTTGMDGPVMIAPGPGGDLHYLAIYTGELRRLRYTGAPPAGGTRYLSDLAYTVTANGYGPVEKDRSNGEDAAGDGGPLTINGATYAKGLGVHAAADVRYAMGGGCTTFAAKVGVDDEVGDRGSVVFQVFADGAKLYDSGRMTGASATKTVSVNVAGRTTLRLVVTGAGDGVDYDHADWADAALTCGSAAAPLVAGPVGSPGSAGAPGGQHRPGYAISPTLSRRLGRIDDEGAIG